MTTAIAKIIRDDRRCPKNLQTDMGKEFYNANMQKLLKKCNINLSLSKTPEKMQHKFIIVQHIP